MMPVVFTIPFLNRAVPGYGLMMMIGFLAAIWWAARRAVKSKANPDVILNGGFIALFAGVIGARIMYVWHHWEEFAHRGSFGGVLWGIVDVSKGGLEVYGGFILASLLLIYYFWRAGHSIRWYLDIAAPSGMVGLAVGRIGCFLNGCCWGSVCNLPWAIEFPYGSNPQIVQWNQQLPGASLPKELILTSEFGITTSVSRDGVDASDAEIEAADKDEAQLKSQLAALDAKLTAAKGDAATSKQLSAEKEKLAGQLKTAETKFSDFRRQMKKYSMNAEQLHHVARSHTSLPVHPAQLYSTVTASILAVLLSAFYYRRTRDGQVVCLLFILEPLARILLEIIRDDNPVDTFGFTISQFLAVCMTLGGIIGLIVIQRLPARSPAAVTWDPESESTPKSAKTQTA